MSRPCLTLTAATVARLAGHAIGVWVPEGEPRPDGLRSVPVDPDVHQRIERMRYQGESDDDVVGRLLDGAEGRRPS